jgi:amidase
MREPLHRRTARELVSLVQAGEASAGTVARSFIDAIAEREREVRAFASFDAQLALARASAAERAAPGGALRGLPVAVKDNIDTATFETRYGSTVYAGHRPNVDAACVVLLADAGAYVIGKTVTAEFANFTPGPTTNPHNPGHTPGGSSSGSAAAVAAHFAPAALGTQTAGSVIRPAAFCGVPAYKPSPRLIPRAGVKPNSDTLDEVGVFGRCVDDLALIASVLASRPAWSGLAAQGREAAAPTLGWHATARADALEPAMLAALERAAQCAFDAGAKQAQVTWPRVFDGLFDAQRAVQLFETARALAPEFAYRRAQLSPLLIEVIEEGRAVPAPLYVASLQLGRSCAAAIESLFGAAEVVLVPSAPGEAPAGLGSTGDPLFNRPWQLLGCPVVNLPCGRGPRGLPLGVSVIGRPGDDARTLSAAAWVEAKLGAVG